MISLLTDPQYGRVAPIEVLWSTIVSIGLIASTFTIRDALAERKRAHRSYGDESPEGLIAETTLVIEVSRWIQQFLLLVAGIVAMTQPEPAPPPSKGYSETLRFILVAFAVLLASNSVYVRFFRRKLMRLLRRARGESESEEAP